MVSAMTIFSAGMAVLELKRHQLEVAYTMSEAEPEGRV